MSDEIAGTDAVESGAPEAAGSGPGEQGAAQPAGGGNPSWQALRDRIGEPTFRLIENDLKQFDTSASDRIARTNAELKRYTDLGEYDSLQTGLSVAQQIDQDPVAFYQRLGEILQQGGQLEFESGPEDEIDESEGEEKDPRDARIAALEEALNRINQGQETAEQQRMEQGFADEWGHAFAAAKASNPWLSDEDEDTLRALAAPHVTDEDSMADIFGKALANLTSIRNRTLSAPRAGASAPRLIPSSGGNPAAAQPQDVSKMDRKSTVNLVADMLRAKRG